MLPLVVPPTLTLTPPPFQPGVYATRLELDPARPQRGQEVKKGQEANPAKVERWLHGLAAMADDIFQVTVTTLVNPVAGVGQAIRLIAQKARGEEGKSS